MTDGFLGRWSRRKNEMREGKPVVDAPGGPSPQPAPASGRGSQKDQAAAPVAFEASARQTSATAADVTPAHQTPSPVRGEGRGEGPAEPPPPTLEDAQALTPSSDFKPFMAQSVAQDVRNAAVKKLFADPHFNVMDRLDTYIDDYGLPDPIPAAMLRRMASAKVLKLFDDVEDGAPNTPTDRDDPDTPPRPDVAQSQTVSESPALPANAPDPLAAPTSTQDAHTDLRLQPDHASQRESAGPGT